MRIYLDARVVCRIFDVRSQTRVRSEAEAIERLLQFFADDRVIWVVRDVLLDELPANPDKRRRNAWLDFLKPSRETVAISGAVGVRAKGLEEVGYGLYDALHLAFAEYASVEGRGY